MASIKVKPLYIGQFITVKGLPMGKCIVVNDKGKEYIYYVPGLSSTLKNEGYFTLWNKRGLWVIVRYLKA